MINVKVENVKNKKFIKFLWILFAIMISFTTSDLICGFTGNITLALIFSCLSGAVVVYGNLKTRKIELDENLDTIKKSFNNSNIIFAVLDIICSIIALLTGIVFIGLIFRAIWAVRITVIINKFRTVARILQVGSFAYLIKRRFYMKEFLKANKWSLIFGFLGFAIVGILAYSGLAFALPIAFTVVLPLWANVLIASVLAILAFIIVFFLGHETKDGYAVRKLLGKVAKVVDPLVKNETVKNVTNTLLTTFDNALEEKAKEEEKIKVEKQLAIDKELVEQYENAKKRLEQSNPKV